MSRTRVLRNVLHFERVFAPSMCRRAREMTESSLLKPAVVAITSCLLSGCGFAGGAPSFEMFGAFFPAWMLCAFIGIVGAASTRVVLTTPAFSDVIPFQLAVCTAIGVIVGLLAWMALFG